jgi:hypothetical protein
VLPGRAKASNSHFECEPEGRAHFPLLMRAILRDEFGNAAVPDITQLAVEASGAGLDGIPASIFPEPDGSFGVTLLPREAGQARLRVTVGGELLAERELPVRGVAEWSTADARDWAAGLGWCEPRLAPVAPALADRFLRQGVSGAKIAGGLLDRGAFHFAFGVEDVGAAQFLADWVTSLSGRGPALAPWGWSTPGAPAQRVALKAGDAEREVVEERLRQTLPGADVSAVERVEDSALYQRYAAMRAAVGAARDGGPNERLLWHAAPPPAAEALAERGFVDAAARGEQLVAFGKGFYFSADPRLADMWHDLETADGSTTADKGAGGGKAGKGAGGKAGKGAERCLVLARVACGTLGERPALAAAGVEVPEEDLARLENRSPPPSCHTATGPARAEAVAYWDHLAYPAYLIRYSRRAGAAPVKVRWPRGGGGGDGEVPPLGLEDDGGAAAAEDPPLLRVDESAPRL